MTTAARDSYDLEKKYKSCQREPGVLCDVSTFTGGTHLRVAVASSECERDTGWLGLGSVPEFRIPLVFRLGASATTTAAAITRPVNTYLTFARPQPHRLPSANSNVLFLGGPQNSMYHKLLRTTKYISGCARMRIGSASVVLDTKVLRFSTKQLGRSYGWGHAYCRTAGSGLGTSAMLGFSRAWCHDGSNGVPVWVPVTTTNRSVFETHVTKEIVIFDVRVTELCHRFRQVTGAFASWSPATHPRPAILKGTTCPACSSSDLSSTPCRRLKPLLPNAKSSSLSYQRCPSKCGLETVYSSTPSIQQAQHNLCRSFSSA